MAALNNDMNPENNFLEGQHFIIGTLNVIITYAKK